MLLITLHGFPAAKQLSGTSFVTTLPAPITVPLPMVTPGRIIAPPPIQQDINSYLYFIAIHKGAVHINRNIKLSYGSIIGLILTF